MADYVTLVTLKARLGITDTNDDTQLALYITAASRAIDRWCKRADNGFVGTTKTRVFDVPPTLAGALRVLRAGGDSGGFTVGIPTSRTSTVDVDPLLSITTLKTDADATGAFATTWLTTDYELLPINAVLDGVPYRQVRTAEAGQQQFPVGQKRLQIVGSWGEATAVHPVIQEATVLTVLRWFKRRDAPFGIIGNAEMGMMHVSGVDPDVVGMLDDAGFVEHWYLA